MKLNLNLKNWQKATIICSIVIFMMALTAGLKWYLINQATTEASQQPFWTKKRLAELLAPHIETNIRPSTLSLGIDDIGEDHQLEYSIDLEMQEYTDRLMKRFRPDYGALVAIDSATGEILTMTSYSHENHNTNLSLWPSFPAASIFKIVTAAAALDLEKVTPNTTIVLTGRSHTLYRRDVIGPAEHRWSRLISITQAFATSTNTLFGKLGLYYVGGDYLKKYATRFGFNKNLNTDFPLSQSSLKLDTKDDWGVVETASGYNDITTLSPVHGAMIAASVVNDGVMMEPYLVKSVANSNGELLYQAAPKSFAQPINLRANNELKTLMEATVRRGTSRKAFRKLINKRLYSEAKFGGKTGSLTGKNPMGKTDWFVGYMEHKGRRIAIASVLVHGKIWRIRSSQLASTYLEEYLYRSIIQDQQKVANH